MWSSPAVVTPPQAELVTVAKAKEFLAVEDSSTDTLIAGFIAAARERAQDLTGCVIGEQVLDLRADHFDDLARLPIGPVSGVVSIAYRDAAGAMQAIPPAGYELTGAGARRGLRAALNSSWPGGLRAGNTGDGDITVRVNAGFTDAALPHPLRIAMLLMIGDMFAFRESAVTGTVAAAIPTSMRVEQLLSSQRIWR